MLFDGNVLKRDNTHRIVKCFRDPSKKKSCTMIDRTTNYRYEGDNNVKEAVTANKPSTRISLTCIPRYISLISRNIFIDLFDRFNAILCKFFESYCRI